MVLLEWFVYVCFCLFYYSRYKRNVIQRTTEKGV